MSLKLGNCAKIAPRFCGPFEILSRIGPIAYQLALPANLRIHNVFHVSLLKKYVHDPTHMIDWNLVQVEPKGDFQAEPLHILDWREITLRNRVRCDIPKNKVFLKFKICWKIILFLVNSNLENFCHLWQFRILNLIIVINYYDCWAEI
jgi:hypothetical protein